MSEIEQLREELDLTKKVLRELVRYVGTKFDFDLMYDLESELPDGGTCFRIGEYIDAPVQLETELSRFLPDGCKWRMSEDGTEWYIELQESWLFPTHQVKTWNYLGLLHPSEGGGFQKHTLGDPMPCDGKLRVDVIAEIGDINYGYEAESWLWGHCYHHSDIYGWRPHYEEQN
jgi:hypothetical protein